MDKSSSFFEKNVEWIALGIGALFLLYIGYACWYQSPVTISLGGEEVTPAKVDTHIQDKAEQPLASRMSQRDAVPMPRVDVADRFAREFKKPLNTDAVAVVPVVTPPRKFTPEIPQDTPITGFQAERLVKVPVVEKIALKSGRSFCAIAPPMPAPVNPNAPVPPPVGRPVAQPQPVVVMVGGVQVTLPPENKAEDAYWNTLFGKFNVEALMKDIEESKVPKHLQSEPIFVALELERVEIDPLTGKEIGSPVTLKPLPMNQMPVSREKVDDYVDYVSPDNMQAIIMQPPFHQVLAGSPWGLPGQEVVVVNPADVLNQLSAVDQLLATPFNAETYAQQMKTLTEPQKNQVRMKLTPEQRGALYKAEQELKAKDRPTPPPNTTTKPPRTTRERPSRTTPRGGAGAPEDADMLNRMFAQLDPREVQGFGRVPARPGRDGVMMPPPVAAPAGGVILAGNLVPDAQGNVDVWAHDGQAQPGKTYKYRMRVVIFNPIYGVENAAKDQSWAKIPYLPHDQATGWSAWSEPVTIPTSIDMQFVDANMGLGGKTTRAFFRVRRWQHGQENYSPKNFEVEPGDMIGGMAAASAPAVGAAGAVAPPLVNPVGGAAVANATVDYTTGWTLVDIRKVGDDFKARLIDASGQMVTRSLKDDMARSDFKVPVLPVAPGVPTAPGVPMSRLNNQGN